MTTKPKGLAKIWREIKRAFQRKTAAQIENGEFYGVELINKYSLKNYVDAFFAKQTPARMLHDYLARSILKKLTGKVIEIGAISSRNYYETSTVNAEKYIKTNLYPDSEAILMLDATNMDLEDNSVDGIICLAVLEHIYDYDKALSEFYRVLKPGGTLVISAPFLYGFHAAPCDYFRFTHSFWREKMKEYQEIKIYQIGNKCSVIAHLLRCKGIKGFLFANLCTLFFMKISTYYKKPDRHALLYLVLAVKDGGATCENIPGSYETYPKT